MEKQIVNFIKDDENKTIFTRTSDMELYHDMALELGYKIVSIEDEKVVHDLEYIQEASQRPDDIKALFDEFKQPIAPGYNGQGIDPKFGRGMSGMHAPSGDKLMDKHLINSAAEEGTTPKKEKEIDRALYERKYFSVEDIQKFNRLFRGKWENTALESIREKIRSLRISIYKMVDQGWQEQDFGKINKLQQERDFLKDLLDQVEINDEEVKDEQEIKAKKDAEKAKLQEELKAAKAEQRKALMSEQENLTSEASKAIEQETERIKAEEAKKAKEAAAAAPAEEPAK